MLCEFLLDLFGSTKMLFDTEATLRLYYLDSSSQTQYVTERNRRSLPRDSNLLSYKIGINSSFFFLVISSDPLKMLLGSALHRTLWMR